MAGETNINISELGIDSKSLSAKDQLLYREIEETNETTNPKKTEANPNTKAEDVLEDEKDENLNPTESNGQRFLKDVRIVFQELLGDAESQKSWIGALSDKVKMIGIRARVGITKATHSEAFVNVMDFCKDSLPNSTPEFVALIAMIALPVVLEKLKTGA